MPDIRNTDRLIALFIAALCTGVYFCTLLSAVRWLVFTDDGWRIRKQFNLGVLAATLAIAAFSTTHTVLAITTSLTNLREAESPTHASAKPAAKVPWESVVMCTVVNTSVLIVDGFLIYRCWVVSSYRKRRIVFPGLFWIGGLVCTILQLYWQLVQTTQTKTAWTPVNMSIGPGTVLTPFWGCTIVVNIYATSVIVYHIWVVAGARRRRPELRIPLPVNSDKSSVRSPSTPMNKLNTDERVREGMSESARELRFIMRVLIESGALYLLITIPHFAVWWTSSGLAIVMLGWANLPVVGAAFNLIIVRTAQHRVETEKMADADSALISAMKFELPRK